MVFTHIVQAGDCVSAIAFENGLLPDTVWKHARNAELRKKRKDPNILMPGDEVFVPDRTPRVEYAATDQVHKYLRHGVPEIVRVNVEDREGNPRANVPYVLTIDGTITEGTTGDDGLVTVPIPPNARSGSLVVGDANDEEGRQEFDLMLGHLNPVTDITGVQQRLINLGFDCGAVDGVIGPRTSQAIARFQEYSGLEPTGELDSTTQARLESDHQS